MLGEKRKSKKMELRWDGNYVSQSKLDLIIEHNIFSMLSPAEGLITYK
jgi:hypothetical protein